MAIGILKKVWYGCSVEEFLPYQHGFTSTPRSDVAVGVREGLKCSLEKRMEIV